MVALGGRGTLLGPALGAAAIVGLKNLVSVYTHRWLLILGGVYIGTIVYAPEGIVGAIRQWTKGERTMGKKAVVSILALVVLDRKSTRLNSSHRTISYAVFCLKKKKEYVAQ